MHLSTIGARQVRRSGDFHLDCSAESAFPLFSPEGEREWIKEWNPQPVFPDTIEFRRDTVFRQGDGVEEAVWTIVDADWQTYRAEYVRVAPASHTAHVVVQVDPVDSQHSHVVVSYTITAWGEHGGSVLEAFSEDTYASRMRNWQRQIGESLEKRTVA